MIVNQKTGNIFYDENLKKRGMFIDWSNCIGSIVNILYNNKMYEFKIINYNSSNNQLDLLYDDNITNCITYNFTKCNIKKTIGLISSDFKFKSGQIIKDEKRDFIIIEMFHREKETYYKNRNKTYINHIKTYRYKCNRCGNEDVIFESDLLAGNGCNVCSGSPKKVTQNKCLSTVRPDLIKYLKNQIDGEQISVKSNKSISCTCPVCKYEKDMIVSNLTRRGFSCPVCGDGFKYPEKFMSIFLHLCKIKFKNQLTRKYFGWIGNYRYDFYFEFKNEKFIVETHGEQHYANKGRKGARTLKEEQENDRLKKELALANGIKEENYIVIDCRYSELEWIKNSILNSMLRHLLENELVNVNWSEIDYLAQKDLMYNACEIKNNQPTITSVEISKILNIDIGTVISYLKRGNELKLCKYDPKEEIRKSAKKMSESKKIPVKMYKDGVFMGEFKSSSDLEKVSVELFGIKLLANKIRMVCRGLQKNHKGYVFEEVDIKKK